VAINYSLQFHAIVSLLLQTVNLPRNAELCWNTYPEEITILRNIIAPSPNHPKIPNPNSWFLMAILLGEILQSVELWLKLMKKPQPEAYVNPNLDPVLLVPGVGGSILHAVSDPDGSQERVWVRFLSAEYKLKTKLWSRYDPSTGRPNFSFCIN